MASGVRFTPAAHDGDIGVAAALQSVALPARVRIPHISPEKLSTMNLNLNLDIIIEEVKQFSEKSSAFSKLCGGKYFPRRG